MNSGMDVYAEDDNEKLVEREREKEDKTKIVREQTKIEEIR